MDHALAKPRSASPLMLADRLLTLAEDADRAGFPDAASQLVTLVYAVLDQQTPTYAAIIAAEHPSRARTIGEPARKPSQLRRADQRIARTCQPQA